MNGNQIKGAALITLGAVTLTSLAVAQSNRIAELKHDLIKYKAKAQVADMYLSACRRIMTTEQLREVLMKTPLDMEFDTITEKF